MRIRTTRRNLSRVPPTRLHCVLRNWTAIPKLASGPSSPQTNSPNVQLPTIDLQGADDDDVDRVVVAVARADRHVAFKHLKFSPQSALLMHVSRESGVYRCSS